MQTMSRLRSARYLAWVVASILLFPYMTAGVASAQPRSGITQSVVLFPLDGEAGVRHVTGDMNAHLSEALSAYKGYKVVVYSERLPSVQRLLSTQPERRTAAAGPFSRDETAVSNALLMSRNMQADVMIVGSVDSYQFDFNNGTADITASIQVVDTKSGKTVNRIVAGGHGAKAADELSVNEAAIRKDAIRDVGNKILVELTGEEYAKSDDGKAPVIVAKKKDTRTNWIPMLILSLGVGLLLGSSSSGNGDGSSSTPSGPEAPPPPPVWPTW